MGWMTVVEQHQRELKVPIVIARVAHERVMVLVVVRQMGQQTMVLSSGLALRMQRLEFALIFVVFFSICKF